MRLKPPPSVTAQSGYNRSSLYLCPLRESAHEALDSLPVLLWFFKLQDFALEIIDAGVRIRQLTLKLIHFLAELEGYHFILVTEVIEVMKTIICSQTLQLPTAVPN